MKEADSENYSLVFTFSENDYFTNTELRKRFIFPKGEEADRPEKTEGTEINWKSGKNVTVKKISKK